MGLLWRSSLPWWISQNVDRHIMVRKDLNHALVREFDSDESEP